MAPDGYASEMGDCDDTDDTINPDEPEICDDIDNNCDDGIDEGLLGTAECPYEDCKDILASDSSLSSGLYTVLSDGNPIETWCDMTTDGGGWTLVGYSYNDSTIHLVETEISILCSVEEVLLNQVYVERPVRLLLLLNWHREVRRSPLVLVQLHPQEIWIPIPMRGSLPFQILPQSHL